MAGKRICGPFVGIFDAVQADLEFVRKIFNEPLKQYTEQ